MHNLLIIKQNYLKIIKKEVLQISSKILKKKINKIENIFSELYSSKKRASLFDALNMMISLQHVNYEVKKIIEKKTGFHLLNWTYPQVRLDGDFSKSFAAPLHLDRWILDNKKKGIVVWFPLNEKGSSIFVHKKKKLKKIVRHNYWGLESLDKIKLKKINVPFGKALIFDESLVHQSNNKDNNRVTVQFRYEITDFNNYKRTVNQVIDANVKNFWINKNI